MGNTRKVLLILSSLYSSMVHRHHYYIYTSRTQPLLYINPKLSNKSFLYWSNGRSVLRANVNMATSDSYITIVFAASYICRLSNFETRGIPIDTPCLGRSPMLLSLSLCLSLSFLSTCIQYIYIYISLWSIRVAIRRDLNSRATGAK